MPNQPMHPTRPSPDVCLARTSDWARVTMAMDWRRVERWATLSQLLLRSLDQEVTRHRVCDTRFLLPFAMLRQLQS